MNSEYFISKLLFLLFLYGCSTNYNLDLSDTSNVAGAIDRSLKDQDTLLLKKLYKYNGDSLSELQKQYISEALQFFDQNSPQKLEMDTSFAKPFANMDHSLHHINIWYALDSNFYSLRCRYERDPQTNKVNLINLDLVDLQEECEFDKNVSYTPSSEIDFMGITWHKGISGTSFSSGSVRIQNNSEDDIDYIKFSISLSKQGSNSGIFLRQTIESQESIPAGDIVMIDAPGMRDYELGFPIKSDELIFDAELIAVRPKPESYWCKKITQLKKNLEAL